MYTGALGRFRAAGARCLPRRWMRCRAAESPRRAAPLGALLREPPRRAPLCLAHLQSALSLSPTPSSAVYKPSANIRKSNEWIKGMLSSACNLSGKGGWCTGTRSRHAAPGASAVSNDWRRKGTKTALFRDLQNQLVPETHPAFPGIRQDGRFALRRPLRTGKSGTRALPAEPCGGRPEAPAGAVCRLSSVSGRCAASSLPPGRGRLRVPEHRLALPGPGGSPPRRSASCARRRRRATCPRAAARGPARREAAPPASAPLRGAVRGASAARPAGERGRPGAAPPPAVLPAALHPRVPRRGEPAGGAAPGALPAPARAATRELLSSRGLPAPSVGNSPLTRFTLQPRNTAGLLPLRKAGLKEKRCDL